MQMIAPTEHEKLKQIFSNMDRLRQPWWAVWRDLSDFFLPRRYPWLLSDKERKSAAIRNRRLLDGTSIRALRTLATGIMNGTTSPARPWFRLRVAGMQEEAEVPWDWRVWLEEAGKRMLVVMAESNFYPAIGILDLEWCAFGTASMSIYEDPDTVFRCYNFALGEYWIEQDHTGRVIRLGRKFSRTVEQAVKEFGLEALSPTRQADYKAGGARLQNELTIIHLSMDTSLFNATKRRSARWQDVYWEVGCEPGKLLRARPLEEFPNICVRWEVYADDTYGSSPCMDVLADVIQLQHLIKRRAQGLDKLVDPPLLINKMLANRPKSTLPGGETYVSGQDLTQGARPLYQINMPFQEINLDIAQTRANIREGLFNDLFRMISELQTVRSATEIDARREEKLTLLGPVLERFEFEALSPAINRIFQICLRAGVFPPPPEGLADREIQIQYSGILSDAQRAVGTASIERYLQLLGNMASMFPDDVLDVPDAEEIIREYGDAISLPAKLQKPREVVADARAAREQQRSVQEAAAAGAPLVEGAKQLSETDLGGGQNALQALIGGV